jgi:hypothetical protein
MENLNQLDSEVLLHPRTLREGFTQSELSLMGRCAQKWNWQYNLLLERPGVVNFPFLVGDAFHAAMEEFYITKGERVSTPPLMLPEGTIPSIQDITDVQYWNHVLPAMVRAYTIYYKDDHKKWNVIKCEEEIEVMFRGFRLRGKIDLTLEEPDGLFIVDHKTTSKLDKNIVAGWDFRFQFMFYLWLKSKLQRCKGYYINAVKKPELRIKKTEDIVTFADRVFQDMIIEPDKYYYRERFPVPSDALEHFEKTVLSHKLRKLEAVLDPNTPLDLAKAIVQDKNTDECQHFSGPPCPYLELCRHGYTKMGFLYTRKENKHAELDNE